MVGGAHPGDPARDRTGRGAWHAAATWLRAGVLGDVAAARVKAAELAAAGHAVAPKTIGNRWRRYQAEGLVGPADHRPVRRRPEFGSVPEAVVEAMRKAIKEGVASSAEI